MRERREQIWEALRKEYDENPGEKILIGGDFNCRIGEGEERIVIEAEEEESEVRKTKDLVLNSEGRAMVLWLNETGTHVLNGNVQGDKQGEYTYVGPQGNSVIDFVIVNEEARGKVESMFIGEQIDSDHLSLKVSLNVRCNKKKKVEEFIKVEDWTAEGIEKFKKVLEGTEIEKGWDGI